jgi:recombination protein RecT
MPAPTQSTSSLAVNKAGVPAFADYLKKCEGSIAKVAASHMRPERLTKIALACVTRTPKLKECRIDSIVRSVVQSAELGLEPGSALGEAYLVPYKDQCQLIVGYRGLISLAFRSGHVKSISAREVYEGDTFEFELGLEPKLRHVPADVDHNPAKITHAYCVVQLKDGGIVSDVMTIQEINRIRSRSKAKDSGPWVSDFAEMAKKTVTRRALKYAPMSVEMSQALALDAAADTGDYSALEFESIDAEYTEAPSTTGTEAVKAKLEQNADDPTADVRKAVTKALAELKDTAKREELCKIHLNDTPIDSASLDQLQGLADALAELKG